MGSFDGGYSFLQLATSDEPTNEKLWRGTGAERVPTVKAAQGPNVAQALHRA